MAVAVEHSASRRRGPALTGDRRDTRILLVALCVATLVGLLSLLAPLETVMQNGRNKLRAHDTSGQVVIVAIDNASLAELGPAPWSRTRLAKLVADVSAGRPRGLTLALDLSRPAAPADDAALQRALARAPNPSLVARFDVDAVTAARRDEMPLPRFADRASVFNANLWTDRHGGVWLHPYAATMAGRSLPSLASGLAGESGGPGILFPIDYALSARSVPVISAADLLSGRWTPAAVRGRDVVIAETHGAVPHSFVPGFTRVPDIFIHALAAETLREGRPLSIGWLVPMLVAAGLALLFLRLRNRLAGRAVLALAVTLFLLGPAFLEHMHLFARTGAGVALLAVVAGLRAGARLRQAFQARGQTNAVSGLPNLNALRQVRTAGTETLVVARITNFAQVSTALPADCERELVEQIASRLGFGTGGATVFQGDEGLFTWLATEPRMETLVGQLDGLHALFRSPVIVAGRLVDLSIAFGLETDGSRPVPQRLASALVAADTAAADGRRWAAHDPASLEDAEWRLSLLGQLDLAIRNDEIWVAYQPKLDIASGRIVGAEALARWRHPEKGEIFPSAFIPAAERSGRIENLTHHVLDSAISAAAAINAGGRPFTIAVNLSARLLDEPQLVPTVSALLSRHGLDARCLTLEITETTAMAGEEASFVNLERLNALGVQLSIDDYGTGFSTLEYLKRIPAAEIKIDRSFVGLLSKSQSDRIMVHSTIQLAHSLGRRAVAEGVENEATLTELRRMGCDLVQGYHTGRPMPIARLLERLSEEDTAAA